MTRNETNLNQTNERKQKTMPYMGSVTAIEGSPGKDINSLENQAIHTLIKVLVKPSTATFKKTAYKATTTP